MMMLILYSSLQVSRREAMDQVLTCTEKIIAPSESPFVLNAHSHAAQHQQRLRRRNHHHHHHPAVSNVWPRHHRKKHLLQQAIHAEDERSPIMEDPSVQEQMSIDAESYDLWKTLWRFHASGGKSLLRHVLTKMSFPFWTTQQQHHRDNDRRLTVDTDDDGEDRASGAITATNVDVNVSYGIDLCLF